MGKAFCLDLPGLPHMSHTTIPARVYFHPSANMMLMMRACAVGH